MLNFRTCKVRESSQKSRDLSHARFDCLLIFSSCNGAMRTSLQASYHRAEVQGCNIKTFSIALKINVLLPVSFTSILSFM